jgi:hypothetical protein
MVQYLIGGVLKYRNTHRAADEPVLKCINTHRAAVTPEDDRVSGHGLDPAVQAAINAGTCIALPCSLSISLSLSLSFWLCVCVCVCAYVYILYMRLYTFSLSLFSLFVPLPPFPPLSHPSPLSAPLSPSAFCHTLTRLRTMICTLFPPQLSLSAKVMSVHNQ